MREGDVGEWHISSVVAPRLMSAIGGQADASTRSFAIALENKGPYLAI